MTKSKITLITSVISLSVFTGTHAVQAGTRLNEPHCQNAYQEKLLKQENRRIAEMSIALGAGLAAIPMVSSIGIPVAAAAIFGGGPIFFKRLFDRAGWSLPNGLKVLTVIDEVVNPGHELSAKDYSNAWLFGERIGYHYRVTPNRKSDTFDSFQNEVVLRASDYDNCSPSEQTIRDAVREMDATGALCPMNKKGKQDTFSMSKVYDLTTKAICGNKLSPLN